MLSALAWVKPEDCLSVPIQNKPSKQQIQQMKQQMQDGKEESDPVASMAVDQPTPLHEARMEAENAEMYENDDDDEMEDDGQELDAMFGTNVQDWMDMDEDEFDDEDNNSEMEDIVIKPSDAILLGAHSEDELSHLDMYIYEEDEDNLYIHHDIMLSSFPLAVSRIKANVPPPIKGLAAVATFEPVIEVWDLDTMEPMMPVGLFGTDESTAHGDAVMCLDFNEVAGNVLASGSADHTIKLWDTNTFQLLHTFSKHTDKVQSVQWNPHKPKMIASGAYDKSLQIFDVTTPEQCLTFKPLAADVESICWNPGAPQLILTSLENGCVLCFDVRQTGTPVWTIMAHQKACSSAVWNPVVPNLFVSASVDKTVKVWGVNQQPQTLDMHLARFDVLTASFFNKSPHLLAIGGQGKTGDIQDRIKVLNIKKMKGLTQFIQS